MAQVGKSINRLGLIKSIKIRSAKIDFAICAFYQIQGA